MIVSCENCHTRFKLDGRRLRSAGVKLRCSKCQHTFELKPLSPAEAESASIESPASAAESAAESVAEFVAEFADGSAANAPAPEEVVFGAPSVETPIGPLDPDEIDRAVDAALRAPEAPAAPEMNQGEGGKRSGRAEDLFGAPSDVDADGSPPEPIPIVGLAASDPRERSEDFDWDHLSFTESRPASVDDALRASEEVEGPRESEPLELDMERPKMRGGRDASPSKVQQAFSEPGANAESVLELARPVSSQSPHSPSQGQPLESRLSPGSDQHVEGGPASGSRPHVAQRAFSRAHPSALRSAKRPLILTDASLSLPMPSAGRPIRPPLRLPPIATLAGSLAVGLLIALVSALTLYAPEGPLARTPAVVRPGGAARGEAALRLEDLSGRRVGRQGAAPLYVVTGRARWSAPPKGAWVLDGVLVDRSGRALQRRTARLGPLAALSGKLDADSGSLTSTTPLPAEGQSGFLILFAPQPTWQADVRFEVRRAD